MEKLIEAELLLCLCLDKNFLVEMTRVYVEVGKSSKNVAFVSLKWKE